MFFREPHLLVIEFVLNRLTLGGYVYRERRPFKQLFEPPTGKVLIFQSHKWAAFVASMLADASYGWL